MFYGWLEAIDFGVNGFIYILLYYIAASLIFNRKNEKVLISGIFIIIYVYTIMLYSIESSSDIWAFPNLYKFEVGLLNGMFFIPFIVFCFAADLISFLVRKYIKGKETPKKKHKAPIVITILVILSIAFQFIFIAFLDWWGTSGKYEAVVNKAIQYEKNDDFEKEIDILKEEQYNEQVRERVRYLYDKKLEELYNEGKYKECIELTRLLEENFDYKSTDNFYRSLKPGYGNFAINSYARLYEAALKEDDTKEMVRLRRDILKTEREDYLKEHHGISFDNLTNYDFIKYAEVGDVVTLGKYYLEPLSETKQKRDVKWVVYEVSEDELFLASTKSLEAYTLRHDDKYYNSSNLKTYLNTEFLHNLFDENEIGLIKKDSNQDYISIPSTSNIKVIMENNPNKWNNLKTDYLGAMNISWFTLLRNENRDNEFVVTKYDEETYTFNQYVDKLEKEYQMAILPVVKISKSEIDSFEKKEKNDREEKKSKIASELKKKIEEKKTIKEHAADEMIDNIDTISFGKRAGKSYSGKASYKKAKEINDESLSNDEYYEWIILERDEDKALLLSKNVIYSGHYKEYFANSEDEKSKVSWENSDVRFFMNREFLNELFDDYEKEVIIDTEIPVTKNPRFGTYYGEATKDKIFALSVEECLKYFTNGDYELNDENEEIKKLAAGWDEEAKNRYLNLLYHYEKENENLERARFWLRDLGEQFWNACFVDSNGAINTRGEYVANGKMGYRPAMWVKLK